MPDEKVYDIANVSDETLVMGVKAHLQRLSDTLEELQKRSITVQLDLAALDNGSGTIRPVLALRGVWKNLNPSLIMRVK